VSKLGHQSNRLGAALSPTRRALEAVVGLGRHTKRLLLVINDAAILTACLWLGFSVRYGIAYVPASTNLALLMALAPVIGIVTFFWFGLYRIVTRYMGGRTVNLIAFAVALSTLLWAFAVFLSGVPGVPRLAMIIYATTATVAIWTSRQVAGWLLKSAGVPLAGRPEQNRLPVLVYGAGQAGLLLAGALERSERYVPIGFIDRNPSLWGQYVGGYKVYKPSRLPGLVERYAIKEVLVALPQPAKQERVSVLRELEALSVTVRTLPALDDIASGRVTISDLRPVEAMDLLGRDAVPPNPDLLARSVTGKTVLVTGAGGSIGSELCRQIVRCKPAKLVLLDLSENALYEIEGELQRILASLRTGLRTGSSLTPGGHVETQLVPVLGSVLNAALVDETLASYGVQTIYHAAAYKHVPLLERNVFQGLDNNVFGTLAVARAAAKHDVERLVLVSTDKAVRPTNVMGASKRLAELALQAMAAQGGSATVFTIVRFGNVLDSSGSVVRRFRQQIAAGGPVTVTHPDMIRYFMSIPEAASLVIQAGAMATGGEVFVLDMGEPVKIDDLARSMIRLSGLQVRDAATPDGDIAIAYIGLRPGEKMREELLIGKDTSGTEHPRIQTSREPSLTLAQLDAELNNLRAAMSDGQLSRAHEMLQRTVEGYRHTLQPATDDLAGRDSLGYVSQHTPTRTVH
jgi:FlaA1/EpsC-like NDP-sugar epimerase